MWVKSGGGEISTRWDDWAQNQQAKQRAKVRAWAAKLFAQPKIPATLAETLKSKYNSWSNCSDDLFD